MNTYQDHSRAKLWNLLGDVPQLPAEPKVLSRKEQDAPGYRLERLTLGLNGIDDVPAFFIKPAEGEGPWPCVIYNHSHGGFYDLGKRELIDGVEYQTDPPYAVDLTRLGCCVLAIDHWAFGGRQGRGEMRIAFDMLWRGQVMWGMMLYDSIRAIDYATSRPDVDAERIATLGMSMGSTMAWWLAAMDSRVRVCVDICCLTEFHTFERLGGFHAPFYYVPALLQHFRTSDINALIAPRPHLSLAGIYDNLTPVEGLDIVDADLQRLYTQLGCADHWRLSRYPVAHQETPEMRREALEFLDRFL
jgi:acetyl esterase/lipase